jgi:hypothetical protein
MGARGRPTISTHTQAFLGQLEAAKRPDPPATLEAEAAAEWRKVVNRMPPDWFPDETLAVLEQRCRHVVWMRRTADEIEKMLVKKGGKFKIEEYNFLQRLAITQSRMLLNFDDKMRLTQQSTHDKSKRKGAARTKKIPWQEEAEE